MLGNVAHGIPEAQVVLDDVDDEAVAAEQVARHVGVVLRIRGERYTSRRRAAAR